jgi:hypothetical protein
MRVLWSRESEPVRLRAAAELVCADLASCDHQREAADGTTAVEPLRFSPHWLATGFMLDKRMLARSYGTCGIDGPQNRLRGARRQSHVTRIVIRLKCNDASPSETTTSPRKRKEGTAGADGRAEPMRGSEGASSTADTPPAILRASQFVRRLPPKLHYGCGALGRDGAGICRQH